MARNVYDVGDLVRVSVTFTDEDGDTADPTGVVMQWKITGGAATTYTYGVDDELVKDGTGLYHVDVTVGDAASGQLVYYRWEGTGAVVAAVESAFQVRRTVF